LYGGRFVVVHPCSTFSDCCQFATPLNAEVQETKNSKNWGFFAARGRQNKPIETVNDLVLSQEYKLQTHRTVRELSRETGIHWSSVSWIICKDLHLICFKRRCAQELTDENCAARMKRAKLLQKFPQYATDFVFFIDKKDVLSHFT